MPLKSKSTFHIHPESISSDRFINGIKDGSIFSYYDDQYYLNYKKIIPWEIYNVNKYVPTEKELVEYANGAMWFRQNGKWIYIGPFKVEESIKSNDGIGYMIIGEDFIVS